MTYETSTRTWTHAQRAAIEQRGTDILVAASAGSGKTAVLIARIVRLLLDETSGVDLTSLLVVTFTKAAAAQMRQRLRTVLTTQLQAQPTSQHLRKQLSLFSQAYVMTIHSFCAHVVRTGIAHTDVDPTFRLVQETEQLVLQQEAIDALLEQRYRTCAPDAPDDPFLQLVDTYGGRVNDELLVEQIRRLHEYAWSQPFPYAWLERIEAQFALWGTDGSSPPWFDVYEALLLAQFDEWHRTLQRVYDETQTMQGPYPYAPAIMADVHIVTTWKEVLRQDGYVAWVAHVEQQYPLKFTDLPRITAKHDVDPLRKASVQNWRNDVKKQMNALADRTVLCGYVPDKQRCHKLSPCISALVSLVKEYEALYQQRKRARKLLDFTDLEHQCLALLLDPASTPEHILPSPMAYALQRQFTEVLIDEYQDTNGVQETILRCIARQEVTHEGQVGNRFMVGDVKQSIYRFRRAQPELFLHKYAQFSPLADGEETPDSTRVGDRTGVRIDLRQNFRSRPEVLQTVNALFQTIMTKEGAEMAYDERAHMQVGAVYVPSGHPQAYVTELYVIDGQACNGGEQGDAEDGRTADDENADDVDEKNADDVDDSSTAEARMVATRLVRGLTASPDDPQAFYVVDDHTGALRRAQLRDIVILLRKKTHIATYVNALQRVGIEAYASLSEGFFATVEIQTIVSLLQVIDNPLQDIPLAAVLRAPFSRFTDEELVAMRTADRTLPTLYEAMHAALETAQNEENVHCAPSFQTCRLTRDGVERLRAWVQRLAQWRTYAREHTVSQLVAKVYRDTRYDEYVFGLPKGDVRKANLHMLLARAQEYERSSFRGLFDFLRFLERLRLQEQDIAPANVHSEQDDVVRLMTIHTSKGLEFPIVVVAGLGGKFNQTDEKQAILIHKELGIGSRFIDLEKGISLPTLSQWTIQQQLRYERLAEEMRVLYVALTRAKEKLILCGTVSKGFSTKISDWARWAYERPATLTRTTIQRAACFFDWIMPAVMQHPDAQPWCQTYDVLCIRAHEHPQDIKTWHIQTVTAVQEVPPLIDHVQTTTEYMPQTVMQYVETEQPVPVTWTIKSDDVRTKMAWQYPYTEATRQEAKLSVSQWRKQVERSSVALARTMPSEEEREDEEDEAATQEQSAHRWKKPQFILERTISPAQRGMAYHIVMYLFPLAEAKQMTRARVETLLMQWETGEWMSPKQREAVDAQAIVRFWQHDVGKQLQQATVVGRELPFSVGVTRSQLRSLENGGAHTTFLSLEHHTAHAQEDLVLIQGVVDCLFETSEGLVLLDYKTESTVGKSVDQLREQYRLQVEMYTWGVSQALQRRVARRVLYFFSGNMAVWL